MKKIIIILIALTVLIFGAAILFINPILNSAKPQILDKITEVLKTKVTVGDIEVSIFPKPRFILKDLVVGDAGEYKQVVVKEFSIFVSTKEIFSGIVSVSSVSLFGADVPIFKKNDGTLLVGSYPINSKKAVSETVSENDQAERQINPPIDSNTTAANNETLNLKISEVNIKDLKVFYKEESGLDFNINKLDLTAIDDTKENYNVKSNIQLEDNDQINITGLVSKDIIFKGIKSEGKLDLDINIDVANNIKNLLVKLKQKMSYEGDLNKILCKVTKQEQLLLNLSCSGTDTGNIRGTKLSIDDIKAVLDLSPASNNNLENLKITLADSTIESQVTGLGKESQNALVKIKNLDIGTIFNLTPDGQGKELPVTGTISSVQATAIGQPKPKGTYDVSLLNVSIKKLNIFKNVFNTLETIPVVGAQIMASLPGAYKAMLISDSTELSSILLKGDYKDKDTNISFLEANSKGFKIKGTGQVVSNNITLNLNFIILPELVTALEAASNEVTKLKSEDGSILIPIKITKNGDAGASVSVDISRLLKTVAGNQLKESATKALDKVAPGLGGVLNGFLN